MALNEINDFTIVKTTKPDLDKISWLFDQAINLQGKNGYKVWDAIDKPAIITDMEKGLQYKMEKGRDIICIFSIQLNDPFIWREKDKNDAIYLHRIVVNPDFKGLKQFEKVLNWAKNFARQQKLKYIRMDTWADNLRLIDYYKSFEFVFIENYQTTNAPELPIQNRNLNVALLEMKIKEE